MLHEAMMAPAGNTLLTLNLYHTHSTWHSFGAYHTLSAVIVSPVSAEFTNCWRQNQVWFHAFHHYNLSPHGPSTVPHMIGAQWMFSVDDDMIRTLFSTPVQNQDTSIYIGIVVVVFKKMRSQYCSLLKYWGWGKGTSGFPLLWICSCWYQV